MSMIVTVPNTVLTTPAKGVVAFDKKLQSLIADMRHTLLATRKPKGVGLAAPQIGESYRVFITRPDNKSDIRVFINPEIIKKSQDLTDGVPERENLPAGPLRGEASKAGKFEGCLSIPKIWGKVSRYHSLTLKFQDEKGTYHTEDFSGFLATIIQHETDHINGILFTRRVLEQKGKFFQAGIDKEGKETFEEIHL